MTDAVAMSSDDRPVDPRKKDRLAAARAANARNGVKGPKVQRSAITNGSKLLSGIDGRRRLTPDSGMTLVVIGVALLLA